MGAPDDPQATVVIGMPQIYAMMQQVKGDMSMLLAKFDTANAMTTAGFEALRHDIRDLEKVRDDHEERIRQLSSLQIVTPRAMWTGVGVVITGFGVLTALLAIIIDVIGK